MSTKTWTLAPSGSLQNPAFGARPVLSDECGRAVFTQAPARGSGLPMAGVGVAMGTATAFITHLTTPDFGTSLGIPSSRRPSS